MTPIFRLFIILFVASFLASCGSAPKRVYTKKAPTRTVQAVRIKHIDRNFAAQELMLSSMSLVGTPYRYGGINRDTGFDCSGMIQYLYKTVLGVNLPRTANDMAYAGIKIPPRQLKVGDLVFFNTTGKPFSHVGLYIGNNQFIHSPNSRSVIKTNKLTDQYYAKNYTGARTYFVN